MSATPPEATRTEERADPTRGLGSWDRVILLACVITIMTLVAVLSGYPQSSGGDRVSGNVGVATLTLFDVRRRHADSLVWEALAVEQNVYGGDSIFVAPSSVAVLDLSDGTRLDLDEGTLITIDPRAASIQLTRGGVSAKTSGASMLVKTAVGNADLNDDSVASIRVHENAGVQVEVSAGGAVLEGSSGAHTLRSNQASGISAEGHLGKLTTWAATLRAPTPSERVFFHSRPHPIPFRYEARPSVTLFLQVSTGVAFTELEHSMRAKDGTAQWQPEDAGVFWWRLINEWGEPQSETRRLVVARADAPRLLGPAHRALVHQSESNGLIFEWKGVGGATGYQLELASNRVFDRPILTQRVSGERFAFARGLSEGTYHWRVRAEHHEFNDSPFSKVAEFRFVEAAVMDAPEQMGSRQIGGGK